jgi:hypothetical protein
MSNRLDKEREAALEPERMKYAMQHLNALGFSCDCIENEKEIRFIFKGERVKFYPYSGWHTGKSIKDGRGLQKLLDQLK